MVAKNNDFIALLRSALVEACILHRKQESIADIFHYHRTVNPQCILDLPNKSTFFHTHKQIFRNEADI